MSTTSRHRRLNPAESREQILDAANALFAERGYDDVLIEDISRAAGVSRGLVHHYFGGRKDVYLALLERLGGVREDTLRPPVGRSGRARVADTVSRWLDWTEANRALYLGTIAPGEDIADPDVRRVVVDLVRRAVALLTTFHADIAVDSARLRYALVCWTRMNRAATRRWLRGEATRETIHELLASTLEHVLRTFGAGTPGTRWRAGRRCPAFSGGDLIAIEGRECAHVHKRDAFLAEGRAGSGSAKERESLKGWRHGRRDSQCRPAPLRRRITCSVGIRRGRVWERRPRRVRRRHPRRLVARGDGDARAAPCAGRWV